MASDIHHDTLLASLQAADEAYFNGDVPKMEDNVYDALRREFHTQFPYHPYNQQVGADVRTGKEKLPMPMPSLNQVEIGEWASWKREVLKHAKDIDVAISHVIITKKLDGASVLIEYVDGKFIRAFSRGDGTFGANITRHIKHIAPLMLDNAPTGVIYVRAEVIISINNFRKMNEEGIVRGSNGKSYANARNAVSGMMNATTNDPRAYKYISLVAYECKTELPTKIYEMAMLSRWFEHTASIYENRAIDINHITEDMLHDAIKSFRNDADFELDGIVVYINELDFGREQDRDGENPISAIKYKVASADNSAIAEVIDVEWNISKLGAWKPRVNIEPVQLVGVTVQWATGFNAKFIVDNHIGPGAKVRIRRSGDVVPELMEVILPSIDPVKLPQPGRWNATGVDWVTSIQDLLAGDGEQNDMLILEIKKQQLLDFFTTIDIDGLREGTITMLMQNNVVTLVDIIKLPLEMWVRIVGSNGNKIHADLHAKLQDIEPWKLMGGFHSFGKGMGVRKFKALFKALGKFAHSPTVHQIVGVEGFEETTAQKIVNGLPEYKLFLQDIEGLYTFAEVKAAGTKFANMQIVMTGFRDPDLETLIETEGGKVGTSVSSKTSVVIAKNPSDTSTKLKKARDNGIPILSVDQFKAQFLLP